MCDERWSKIDIFRNTETVVNESEKLLIRRVIFDLKKSHEHLIEMNEHEHYIGSIANWQFIYLINKWERELDDRSEEKKD